MKTGSNLAESSKEGYGSETRDCFADDDDNDDRISQAFNFSFSYTSNSMFLSRIGGIRSRIHEA
jgi:hypothetical protein